MNEECAATRQPVIEDVCDSTQQLLGRSDLFTARRAKAIVELMAAGPEKLKSADLLAVLGSDEEDLPQ